MKPALTILILAVIVLGVLLFQKRDYAPRETIKALEREIKLRDSRIDSALLTARQARDSQNIFYNKYQEQLTATNKAKYEKKQIEKEYVNHLFKPFDSDTARHNALKRLYPSIGNR